MIPSAFRQLGTTLTITTRRGYRRPSIAPKPTFNIKHIRENPELYSQTCLDRNYQQQKDYPQQIVQKFNEWKQLQQNARDYRQRIKDIHRRFRAITSAQPQDDVDLLQEARLLKLKLASIESAEDACDERNEYLASSLPNLTSDKTPIGSEPRLLGYIGHSPTHPEATDDYAQRAHVRIGADFDLLDFTSAATTSGWGWYFLKNQGALLEQALIQYAISVALKHGFSIVSPPSVVYTHIANACGFQPRDQGGEQQTYAIAQKEEGPKLKEEGPEQKEEWSEQKEEGPKANRVQERTPERCLTATAEIPFAGLKADVTMSEKKLPLKIAGASRCYRAEAGARGAETKGLYRVHEFTKVEMFAWTMRGSERAVFDSMLAVQEEILRGLGLYCRILEMPSQDLGASAIRKVDIEAFFPSRRGKKNDGWGEVTSASICTDYQTRRLNTRVKLRSSGQKSGFPSTINGTALAVPRILAALLENSFEKLPDNEDAGRSRHDSGGGGDGSSRGGRGKINIPKVLHPWMHGLEVLIYEPGNP
ncbi:MAG: hypothetical protein LQ345_000698 [Seirophora villosa]|nr:MAG: hypothetical protein LQ345_000698 [Seirophora villosa]